MSGQFAPGVGKLKLPASAKFGIVFACCAIFVNANAQSADSAGASGPAKGAVSAHSLAVVINDDDANSVAVGAYYRDARKIPVKNIIHVRIPNRPHRLSVPVFEQLKQKIEQQLHPEIQAILMAWTAPYAVECNSITSALSLGFDAEQCKQTCARGKPSPYYNSDSARPFDDLGLRPSMLLPSDDVEQAKALIDRGVLSGFNTAPATAYFLTTSDANRNSRASFFPPSGLFPQKKLRVLAPTEY